MKVLRITPRRKAILERVARYIRAHPKEYWQNAFACGTAACLAGHIVAQAAPKGLTMKQLYALEVDANSRESIEECALRALNIKGDRAKEQWCSALFESDGVSWPRKFYVAFRNAHTYSARAKVAAARVRHLIATGE